MKYRNVLQPSEHGMILTNRNDSVIGRALSVNGAWESQYLDLLKQIIRKYYPEGSAIDIIDGGANIGVYTISLARIPGYRVRVFAIEAQRLVYQMLNANVALNSLTNVWTFNRVLSDVDGESMPLECPDPNYLVNFGAFEIPKDVRNSDFDGRKFLPAEPVQTLTLDALNATHCALLKLDIEGMEDLALSGCQETIRRNRPVIFFERHKTDYEKVKALLQPYGYVLWELAESNVLALRIEWDVALQPAARVLL